MGKPRRRFVLVLVEGATEITALSSPITDLFMSKPNSDIADVYFCTLHDDEQDNGDITSKYGVTPDNIENLLGKLFVDPFFAKHQYLYPKNIAEIVHIVDLDGTFIPNDRVMFSNEVGEETIYKEDSIQTADVKGIQERNQRKQDNLKVLISKDKIVIRPKNARNTKTVDYSVYYFSCNMEHYLYHEANATKDMKINNAKEFSLECDFDTDAFIKHFVENRESANMSYCESWDFIQEGLRSLERHTNLDILISKLTK